MPTYALEMFLATLMAVMGLVLLLEGDTFSLAHYSVVRAWVTETMGGGLLLAVGLMRWIAIARNGWAYVTKGRSYTPFARIAGCAVGAGFWLTLGLSIEVHLAQQGGPIPAMMAVAIVVFAFEIYSAMRGGYDAEALDSLGRRKRSSGI